MIAIPASLAVIASLLLGSSVGGALTAVQVAQLAALAIKGAPAAIAVIKDVNTIVQSPAFRSWAAANGNEAIKLMDMRDKNY